MKAQISVYYIPGMDCPVEERLIRDKLAKMAGIDELSFNLMQRKLTVRHLPDILEALTQALASLGMGATLEIDGKKTDLPQSTPIPWKKLALGGLLAAISEGLELWQTWGKVDLSAGPWPVLSILGLLFALGAIVCAGLGTYKKGWIAVSNFNLNINALMSVAVTAAVLIGQYSEAAAVIVLFNLSEAIEAKSLDHAREAIKKLMALTPEMATINKDGQWLEVKADEVMPGAIARVRPGERIPLDGVITGGQSAVNQAAITGESLPVEKKTGDQVYAGSINETGSFEFRVTAAATQSTLARIIHAVEEAQATRAPMQRFVDVFARYYTPCVFLLAIGVAFVPPVFFNAGFYESVYNSLVILIIGCPCALVISTPVSVVSGLAAAAKNGILVKGGVFMERGRLLRWLALDKTGTITTGEPVVANFINLGVFSDAKAECVAASLAARSDHPVSRAIARYGKEKKIFPLHVEHFEAIPGQGSAGEIMGVTWRLGNRRMINEMNKSDPELESKIAAMEDEGKTVVALMNNEGVVALFAVADSIRSTSKEAIAILKKMGVEVIMLTGDNPRAAATIAKEAGVSEVYADMLPLDKLKLIESLETRSGQTGMAGDGINDAPALAKADISFAMAGQGTDTAIETADVALLDDDLRKIPRFMQLSSSVFAILVENISMALCIKVVFFALALCGRATMWMAVFADVGASLLVVMNGLRALKK